MKNIAFLFLAAVFSFSANAWTGYNSETDTHIEIEPGNLVRSGLDIEIYNHDTGQYHEVHVESINDTGHSVDIEVYVYDNDEYRTLEMDKY